MRKPSSRIKALPSGGAISSKRSQAAARRLAYTQQLNRWQQLLLEEQRLQQFGGMVCVINIKFSHQFWAQLHDRSETLAFEMADCIDRLGALREGIN
jgi:hypothetical protein